MLKETNIQICKTLKGLVGKIKSQSFVSDFRHNAKSLRHCIKPLEPNTKHLVFVFFCKIFLVFLGNFKRFRGEDSTDVPRRTTF